MGKGSDSGSDSGSDIGWGGGASTTGTTSENNASRAAPDSNRDVGDTGGPGDRGAGPSVGENISGGSGTAVTAGTGSSDPSGEEDFRAAQSEALAEVRLRAAASELTTWRQEEFISSYMADQRAHQEYVADEGDYSEAAKRVREMSGRGNTLQDLFPTPEWWSA